MPAELKTPAVLTGADRFVSKVFMSDPAIGNVTDILLVNNEPRRIGIAGTRGAVWSSLDGKKLLSVSFSSRTTHVDFVDVEQDGTFEYLNRGGVGWQDSSLLDGKGVKIWEYGAFCGRSSDAIDDMTAGDLDGDGKSEFVVGHNGGSGVHLLGLDGNKRWAQPDGNVWHVEVVDTDGDGILEIIHSNAGGQITIRDQLGKVVKRFQPPAYFSYFSLCRWPRQDSPMRLLFIENSIVYLFDFDGNEVARFDAAHCGDADQARGSLVRFKVTEYLAVIVNFPNWDRSVLHIYDDKKLPVYMEVIGETCASITTLAISDDRTETLLVGGDGKVRKYSQID